MMPERGWVVFGGTNRMLVFQVLGFLAVLGLVAALVVMRKREGTAAKPIKTKSSTRI
jgi:hypothetical protein